MYMRVQRYILLSIDKKYTLVGSFLTTSIYDKKTSFNMNNIKTKIIFLLFFKILKRISSIVYDNPSVSQ